MCKIKRRVWVADKITFSVHGVKKHIANSILFLTIFMLLPSLKSADECPSGFQLASTSSTKYCYSLKKEPEQFSEKFVNCDGNLFTFEKYQSLSLPNPERYTLWTDYKSLHPGGVFFDWSYTSFTGTVLKTTYEVNRETDVNVDDVLCVMVDPVKNFSMVSCDERHHRYCVVEANSDTHELKHVNLTVTIDSEKETQGIILTVDDPGLDKGSIMCFTDSSKYVLELTNLDSDGYTINSIDNGYYWCTHSDLTNYYISDSNQGLYIKESDKQLNLYAVKIKTDSYKHITLDDDETEIERLFNDWNHKLKEYLFYSDKCSVYMNGTCNIADAITFKAKKLHLRYETRTEVIKTRLKRLYLDGQSALLHVELEQGTRPVPPGRWENVLVEYMRPVYYCDEENNFTLGMKQCKGNYNEGVELVAADESPSTAATPQDDLIDKMKSIINGSGLITVNELRSVSTEPGVLLTQVTNQLKVFLNNTEPIKVEEFGKVFDQVDKVLSQEGLNIKGNFLVLLDDIATKVDLNGSEESFASAVQDNFALLVADAQQMPVRGLRVTHTGSDSFTNYTFSIIREPNLSQHFTNENEMVVSLPESVSTSNRRISFVVFRNNSVFQGGQDYYTVNSRVLSVKVENLTKFPGKEGIDIYFKPIKQKLKRNQNRTCAFWKFNNDKTGSWSTEGCRFNQEGLFDKCRCDHLTHFAEILIRTGFTDEIEAALEELSIIGCCVSIFGILLVGLTAATFHSWRRDYSNKIWLQLCTSILLVSVCFLVVVFAQFEKNDILCQLTGIALHYSVLSSFCWMLVAAVISYRKLVLVFSRDPSHKLLRASAFAWGAPGAVVGIVLSVDRHAYAGQYENKSPSGAFCYPSGLALWLAVYAPISLILLSNWTMFVLIVRTVFGNRRPPNHGNTKEAFSCACVSCLLAFLFGLPWVLGFFASNVICVFLFTILVTFQGFVLFLLFVCNKKSRDLWLIRLKIKKATIVVSTTMTDINRNMGGNIPVCRIEKTQGQVLKKRTQPDFSPTGDT